jgi:hypothetical protein
MVLDRYLLWILQTDRYAASNGALGQLLLGYHC